MKIVINRAYGIEQISLMIIFVMGLFSNYIEHSNVWNIILFGDFLLLLILSKKFRKKFLSKKILGWLIALIFFVVINILLSTSFNATVFIDNMMKLLKTLLSCLIIVVIFDENPKLFVNNIINNRKIFNFIWVVNLFILTIQVLGVPLFIKSEWMINNPLYEDNCTGLFGYSGTHILTFYAMFVFLLNQVNIQQKSDHRKNMIFNIITSIWAMVLSTQNDNNTIFIMYMLFFIMYRLSYLTGKNSNATKKIIGLFRGLFMIFVAILVLYTIPSVRVFLNNTLIVKISSSLDFNNYYINGSNERLLIVATALVDGFGWRSGLGLGSTFWVTSDTFYGFRHFGLSSIGSFVFLGGIWFYLFITILYAYMFLKLWHVNIRMNLFYVVILINFIIFVSIFTTIYTFSLSMIWLTMCFVIIHNLEVKD